MNYKQWTTDFSIRHYKAVTLTMVGVTLILLILAAVPSIWPEKVAGLKPLRIDTDPENMLPEDEPVRVFHDRMKEELSLYDMVVVGVVNETNTEGVYNPQTLKNVYELTEYAKTLRWKEDGKQVGVVTVDLIAPSTVDNIEQAGLGTVRFEWLMPQPPKTQEQAIAVRQKAEKIPFLKGTLVSDDGKALALYIPLTSKDLSYKVYSALEEKIAEFDGQEEYHITGLPVAEDTFGVEMFIQMAISAPTAMVVIFILMLVFFRKLVVVISPMIVAMVSVIVTMSALVIAGFPVHIMSSMIPIFIMPIAVLDSIHIISEFFELYQETKDRRETMMRAMNDLFVPMLYTSLTSAAGFASLALTPIPPVQVFGVFVALGIMVAWLLTITFIPAYVMFIKPGTLEKFGVVRKQQGGAKQDATVIGKFLNTVGSMTYRRAKLILGITVIIIGVAIYGISLININDNPVKWFTRSHPIRVADRVLNKHFAGTYMAYLTLNAKDEAFDAETFNEKITENINTEITELKETWPAAAKTFSELKKITKDTVKEAQSAAGALDSLANKVNQKYQNATGDAKDAWDEASLFVDKQKQLSHTFKDPAVLKYQVKLQKAIEDMNVVGKSNSLADIIKTVHRELRLGKQEHFTVPDTPAAVAQCMITYQSSHRPGDLWHFVTPDYRKSSMWVQLKSGDNKDMSRVVRAVNEFIDENPPPVPLEHKWFGLTYINVIWQDKMVKGMLGAFTGSFLVVFLMMTILFRSSLWGFLSMIPLTITIGAIYGAVGLVGKDYDMPVAVLSSMTLGLAVDFAIHFLARSRELYTRLGSWQKTATAVFAEPARAITRNIIVIAVGFLPLLLAPLTPYKTVGTLLATILLVSGVGTLLLLPAMITVLQKFLFVDKQTIGAGCNCAACVIASVTLVALIAVTLYQSAQIGWSSLTWLALVAIPVMAIGCGFMSRRQKCRNLNGGQDDKENDNS
jgi:hypothetical protein